MYIKKQGEIKMKISKKDKKALIRTLSLLNVMIHAGTSHSPKTEKQFKKALKILDKKKKKCNCKKLLQEIEDFRNPGDSMTADEEQAKRIKKYDKCCGKLN